MLDEKVLVEWQELCDKQRKELLKAGIRGEWEIEPDRIEFEHQGFPCLLVRNCRMFNWCGYVGLPKTHPYYKKHYDEVNSDDVEVHGGLTYSESCSKIVCHKTHADDDAWWFGFDCAHYNDVVPTMSLHSRQFNLTSQGQYRTLSYVLDQTTSLADQFARVQ